MQWSSLIHHFQDNFRSYNQIDFKIFYWSTLPVYAAKKDNDAAKFMVSLKQDNSEGFVGAP